MSSRCLYYTVFHLEKITPMIDYSNESDTTLHSTSFGPILSTSDIAAHSISQDTSTT